MKKRNVVLLICFFLLTFQLRAQDQIAIPNQIDMASIGLGVGLDYGGFGANISVYPTKSFGFFAGAGYALAGVGFNGGVKIRFFPNKPTFKANPYLLAMYGYNAAIAVTNATQFNKFFNGPTLGFGFDLRSHPERKNYWSLALLVPIRKAEVNTYIDNLKDHHNVEFKNSLFPVGISFGYRFMLD